MIMIGPDGKGEFGKRFMTMPERAEGRCTQVVYAIVQASTRCGAAACAAPCFRSSP